MRLSFLFITVSLLFTLASCNSGNDASDEDLVWTAPIINLPDSLPQMELVPKPDSLAGVAWTLDERKVKEEACDVCSDISWSWFTLNPDANQRLYDSITAFNWYYLTGIRGVREHDLDSIAVSFFEEAKKDVPVDEEPEAWSESNEVWPAAITKETFTVGGAVYFQTSGAAHGNYASHMENFDVSTGSRLKLNNIVAEPYKFTAIAEQVFRKQKGVASDISLSEAGFSFKDDIFYLPGAFGVFPEGLLFVYAPYEIASYAEGEQFLLVPYSLFASQLTTSYQYLAK